MMKNINKVIISGNLTRDPEVRQSASGSQFMTFGVAVNDRRKNAQGEWEDKPNYVDCTLFGKSVEWLSRDMSRGTKVCVCGKLDYQSWQDKEGNNQIATWASALEEFAAFINDASNEESIKHIIDNAAAGSALAAVKKTAASQMTKVATDCVVLAQTLKSLIGSVSVEDVLGL